MRGSLALLLLLLLPLPLHAEGKVFLGEKQYRVGYGSVVLGGEDRTGPYALPHAPLFAGTEAVTLSGRTLVRETDYWIRYDRGEIVFRNALATGETARVTYRYFPLPLPTERVLHRFRLARGGAEEEEGEAAGGRAGAMTGPLDTGALRVGGSKSFSVLIGSDQELTLEQALRMRVTGNLAPDVRVTAQLTDQNLPFQPEGRSERLEELDQVLIHVESSRFEATLGDYEIRYTDSEFGAYERVLQGALGALHGDRYDVELSGGLSRGEFRSVEVRGSEGKQGPYSLLDLSTLGQVIVAGSDQVWLDGEKLTRGDDNDYVIDYNTGEVTFNPNRAITSSSRIAVDFQVSGDQYRRRFVTSRLRLHDESERFRLTGTFLSEQDDEDEPEAIVLDEAQYDSLALSGDRSPLGSGARTVGDGGDYDTTGGVFVYAGRDSGAFVVSFREVERGEGAYTDSLSAVWGRRIFVYVGEGLGDYTPFVPIPLPSSHNLIGLSGSARLREPFLMKGEIAWTDLDKNILSDRDDGDNQGTGGRLGAELEPFPLDWGGVLLGNVRLRGDYQRVTDRFEPLGRYREPHRDERWMTGDLRRAIGPGRQEEDRVASEEAYASRGGETVWTGSGSLVRGISIGEMRWEAEGGKLSRSGFRSDRWAWTGALKRGTRYDARYREERIGSEEGDTLEGETVRRSGEGSVRFSLFRPSAGLLREEREFRDGGVLVNGTRGWERKVGLRLGEGKALEGEGTVTFEVKDYVDSTRGEWDRWYEGRTDRSSLRWRGPVTVSAAYVHRSLDYGETVSRGNRRSDVGRLELRHGGFGGMVRGNWNYQVTTEELRPRRRVLLRAPEGEEADYDSLGNYFPEEGTFNLEIVEGEPEPVVDLEVSGTITVEPGRRREKEAGRFWKGVRWETFLRVAERSNTDDPASLLLLQPGAFQRNGSTLRGVTVVRQEIRWSDPESEGSARLRYQREDREENEFAALHRDDLIHTLLARGRFPVSRTVTGEVEWNRRLETEKSNDQDAVDLVSDDWVAALLLQPTPRWRFRFPGAYQRERERVREEEVVSVRVEPEAAVNLAVRSRLDASFGWTRFLTEDLDRGSSFLRNRREGIRWRLQLAYEWNRVLSSTLAYSGEDLEGEETRQRFRAEMKAYF